LLSVNVVSHAKCHLRLMIDKDQRTVIGRQEATIGMRKNLCHNFPFDLVGR